MKCQEIPLRTFWHTSPSPNKECLYCSRCPKWRRLSTETRNRAYSPIACDFVVSREKQRCPQFVLGVIKVVCDDEFQVIIQHGEAGDFSVEMRDGRRWERDRVFSIQQNGWDFPVPPIGSTRHLQRPESKPPNDETNSQSGTFRPGPRHVH